MTDERISIQIAGVTLRVRPYQSRERTLKLAEAINARISQIEEESERIDSQRFALEACYGLAVDLAQATDATEELEAELIKALEEISTDLRGVVEDTRDISGS